jgi:hypothetical protein
MLSTAIFVYAATSPVNGYFGGSLYARQGGNLRASLNIFNSRCCYFTVKYLEFKCTGKPL